jgi:hypothetical protein
MPILQRSKVIDLTEACVILGISYAWGRHIYHLWPDYGVRIMKRVPNAHPKFYEEDIYRMLECKK